MQLIAILAAVLIPFAIFGLVAASMTLPVIGLWVRSRSSGVPVGFLQLVGMRLRKLDPDFIVGSYIRVRKAGVDVTVDDLEAHVMAGGDLAEVIEAIIAASNGGLKDTFDQCAAIDLAGRDVNSAVRACVMPQVIVCPPAHAHPMMGVARDGVRLSARVRVTVRADITKLVGGAGEQTVVARVGEGIVGAIGRCASHKDVLASPQLISEYILSRGLDAGTAYEIVSVDIADVDVLDNIGARLAEEQAETDKKVAQARAESRRALAVATELENLAKVSEHQATLTAARANVPLALAESCRQGRIWRSPNPLRNGRGRRLWDVTDT